MRFISNIMKWLILNMILMGQIYANSPKKVGISMPSKSIARWIADGGKMKELFEKAGFDTTLAYAEGNIPLQISQIENMITKGVDGLVIAPVDGTSLSNVLKIAAENNVKIIAYDRLIMESPHVDYYATFNNFQVGVVQGNYIIKALDLPPLPLKAGDRKSDSKSFNIELFAGSLDDNNARFFFNGAMSVLKNYIDVGILKVKSGQMLLKQVATERWDGAVAQARMDNIISAKYSSGERVDAILSPNDVVSIGILSSLKGVGYGSKNLPMPIITGQDAEIQSIKSILAGEQTSTVFKDTRELAKVTVKMVTALFNGSEPEVNDRKTYNNNVKIVPSYLLKPVIVDASNWRKVLLDSGYYIESKSGELTRPKILSH